MTRLVNLLGSALPIIQAPLAGVQDHQLALAVMRAGGLGSLPCAMLDGAGMEAQIGALSAHTPLPFNVNFFAHKATVDDPQQQQQWRATLAPYYAELNLDQSAASSGAARRPFDDTALACVRRFRPKVVSFHFGLPDAALVEQVKATGASVLASATTLAEGLWLRDRGVDAVIAQGLEAGGHRGHFLSNDLSLQMGTFALVATLAGAIDLPIIAAGGIADAGGVAAAMALGAEGVQVGSAYLLCPEARTGAVHRAALRSAAAAHTAVTNIFSGRPARGIVNRLIRELGPMSERAPAFPFAGSAIAPLRSAAEALGRDDFTPLWAGQNVSTLSDLPAGQLTAALARGLPSLAAD